MKFDDASWHYGGDFPETSQDEYGGTHIGLFLRWCFVQGWAGRLHIEDELSIVQAVVDGDISGTDFLFKYCDGKFTDEDLSEDGLFFASSYYGQDGLYLEDYASNFGDLMYIAPESQHDFVRFSEMVSKRRVSGVLTHADARKKRPWWKFW